MPRNVNWGESGSPGCGLVALLFIIFVALLAFDPDVPDDAPGDDCPEHGPYADPECPKCDDD